MCIFAKNLNYNNMKNPKYKIGDKVIFNSQIFIVHDVQYSSTQEPVYFIKGYDKRYR